MVEVGELSGQYSLREGRDGVYQSISLAMNYSFIVTINSRIHSILRLYDSYLFSADLERVSIVFSTSQAMSGR